MALLFFAAWLGAAAQSAPAKPSQGPQHLSPQMQQVGLLYVEAVEDALDAMTDASLPPDLRSDLSDRRFKLVTRLQDRIDLQAPTMRGADRLFYTQGLRALRLLAETLATEEKTLSEFRRERDALREPDESIRQCEGTTRALIGPYTRCDVRLRAIIKGEYGNLAGLARVCPLAGLPRSCVF